MMNNLKEEKEEQQALQKLGFTDRQISKLCRLRKTYGQDRMDQSALDIRHLEFARYLVVTGRLTDGQAA